jgi:hypothetical protein
MSDDQRTVYRIPVKLVVEASLHVLASSVDAAVRAASSTDLQECFTFGDDYIRTDLDGILKFDDVHTSPVLVSIVDITQLTTEESAPNTHPDFLGNVYR